jgi:preprotein translocase subunit Sss1
MKSVYLKTFISIFLLLFLTAFTDKFLDPDYAYYVPVPEGGYQKAWLIEDNGTVLVFQNTIGKILEVSVEDLNEKDRNYLRLFRLPEDERRKIILKERKKTRDEYLELIKPGGKGKGYLIHLGQVYGDVYKKMIDTLKNNMTDESKAMAVTCSSILNGKMTDYHKAIYDAENNLFTIMTRMEMKGMKTVYTWDTWRIDDLEDFHGSPFEIMPESSALSLRAKPTDFKLVKIGFPTLYNWP